MAFGGGSCSRRDWSLLEQNYQLSWPGKVGTVLSVEASPFARKEAEYTAEL